MPPEPKTLIGFLKALQLTTLTKRVAEVYDVDAAEIEPDSDLAPGGETSDRLLAAFAAAAGTDAGAAAPAAPTAADATPPTERTLSPAELVESRAKTASVTAFARAHYETLADANALTRWLDAAREAGAVAVAALFSEPDPMRADLIGLALCIEPGRAAYLPFGHVAGDGLFDAGHLPGQLDLAAVRDQLARLFADDSIAKIGHDLKPLALFLERSQRAYGPFEDVMIASYALDAGRGAHDLSSLAERWCGDAPKQLSEATGTGKAALPVARIALEEARAVACGAADAALRLWGVLAARLVAEGMSSVYQRLERPLLPVLARMEQRGIAIDRQVLARLSGEFAQKAAALEAEIHQLAGETFNIGSPKQIGDILFGKLGLPGASKTATGAWSTRAGILEELAEQGYDLPARILDWRQLTKLKSTYTDALPLHVNPQTGRVHTSFALASTSTGRLSSLEPNLQNIPVRTEEGRKIRRAFVAAPGHKLVSADYSQIELRLLAHVANIPQLIDAFAHGIDIHARTASEIFGVPVEGMPPEVRRRAKAINFGIVYGISAFGLANQLGIPISERGRGLYPQDLFRTLPRHPRLYGQRPRPRCRHARAIVSTTLFGRRIAHIPPSRRPSRAPSGSSDERAAINAPIQGAAADIIRRAMIRIEPALAEAKLNAKMLLQVHDELVFEVPAGEVDATLPVVRKVMAEAALPRVALTVPLAVDARAADNWDEAH